MYPAFLSFLAVRLHCQDMLWIQRIKLFFFLNFWYLFFGRIWGCFPYNILFIIYDSLKWKIQFFTIFPTVCRDITDSTEKFWVSWIIVHDIFSKTIESHKIIYWLISPFPCYKNAFLKLKPILSDVHYNCLLLTLMCKYQLFCNTLPRNTCFYKKINPTRLQPSRSNLKCSAVT